MEYAECSLGTRRRPVASRESEHAQGNSDRNAPLSDHDKCCTAAVCARARDSRAIRVSFSAINPGRGSAYGNTVQNSFRTARAFGGLGFHYFGHCAVRCRRGTCSSMRRQRGAILTPHNATLGNRCRSSGRSRKTAPARSPASANWKLPEANIRHSAPSLRTTSCTGSAGSEYRSSRDKPACVPGRRSGGDERRGSGRPASS